MSSQSGGSPDSNTGLGLPQSDEFWRLLIGRKYDRMDRDEKSEENLLEEIYRRDADITDSLYGSKQGLINHLQSDDRNAETVLMTIWGKRKWQEKSPGDKFRFQDDDEITSEFERISEGNFSIEALEDDLFVVWTQKQVSRPREENNTVRSHLDDDWSPLLAHQKGPNLIEIRGAERRRQQLQTELVENGKARKVEKEISEKSALDGLSSIFEKNLSTLDLIEVRFRQSKLPNGSQITIRNEEDVQQDISDESIEKVVSSEIASKISHLKFRDHKSDNIAKIKTVRQERGFSFDIQANYISDEGTENIKDIIEREFSISFDEIYPYHLQYQTDLVLHQILRGSVEAYDTYYANLNKDDREVIDDYIEYDDEFAFICWDCEEEYAEKPTTCDKCGYESFEATSEITVDEGQIFDDILEKINKFDSTIIGDDEKVKFEGLHSEEQNIGTNDCVRTIFRRNQNAGKGGLEATQDYRYEYFVYPLSGRRPKRIGQYLFNVVFITFGSAFEQELENFGTIPLTQLLMAKNPEQLFLEAIEYSHRHRQDRYRKRSKKAVEELNRLQSKVETGKIEEHNKNEDNESTDEFLDNYSAKKFERDVFHVLKSIFMFTERWGREGKKETDGCLTIPRENGEYWVGGYDPKLTTDPKGYNIRSTEKNKVAYYVLEESDRDYIQAVLKRGDPIDAHIFVSDILREGQFETTVSRVQDWFSLTEGDDTTLDVPVIFMELNSLLQLYEIYDRNYNFLREYPDVMSVFREEVAKQLSAEGGYIDFDEESCNTIRKSVIRELNQQKKDRPIQEYAEE